MPATNLVPSRTKSAPKPRIPRRIHQAIDALARGKARTQREAASIVGLSEEHLCRMLKKPQIQAYFAQKTRQTITVGSVRAAERLIQLLDAESEHVSFDASRHVLALEGIQPPSSPQIVNNINVIPGYHVVLPGFTTPVIEATAVEVADSDD